MPLLVERPTYKPLEYEEAYLAYKKQNQMHWMPEEVSMADDVDDFHNNLTKAEKNLITQIFRFFTQADVEVNNCYIKHYMRIFKPPEVLMMLVTFAAMEATHVDAYSHLLDTIGMPETEYQAFLKYKEMKDKYDYMQKFNPESKEEIAKTMAVFGAFTEGLQLFASFVMLINFQRFGKMKGMCQIVAWSIRDETLHTESIIYLFHTFIKENPGLLTEKLKEEITDECRIIVQHEDAFIDLAFEIDGAVQGLTAAEVKQYIRFIANRRLTQLGLKPIYDVTENPLPWVDEMVNAPEFVNFFENRVTEYSRGATQGTWSEAFEDIDKKETS